MSILYIDDDDIYVYPLHVFCYIRAWQSAKTLTEKEYLRHENNYISLCYEWILFIFGISM